MSAQQPNPSAPVNQSPHHQQQQTHNRSLSGTASMLKNQFSDLTSNFSLKNNPITSTNFLSRATSITSQVSNVAGRISSTIIGGKRICGDFDIRVEQTEFRDLTLHAHSEYGTICNVITQKKKFRPDFAFIREHVKNNQNDFTPIILGLRYGNVPSINSLLSVYNFINRPLMYAELINIQRKLGTKDKFPLIEQTFYPSFKDLLNFPPKFPCVIKIDAHHHGLGKLRADSLVHFQELLSILACIDNYLTVEPYIDAKCDIHIQKIGSNYKGFMRKSITGEWKSNIGSAVLEQIQVTDKYKQWADQVSNLFGGLDLVAIEIVETKNNEQFIYEVTGSQFGLLGESQEEDRRLISDLITNKMQQAITSQLGQIPKRSSITQLEGDQTASGQESPLPQQNNQQQQSTPRQSSGGSFLQRMGSISGSIGSTITSVASSTPGTGILTNKFGSSSSIEQTGNQQPTSGSSQLTQQVSETVDKTTQQIRGFFRRESQTTNEDGSIPQLPNAANNPTETTGTEEDTMKNLRKTFAGIFGEN